MVDLLSDHRLQNANIVSHLRMPGQEVADHLPALAVLAKFGQVALYLQFLALKLGDGLSFGEGFRHRFAVKFGEFRFVIERLQVRRSTRHA